MKKIYLFIFLLSSIVAKSQNYGNEWIDYSQKYFKFPISSTGIHRLDYNAINSALTSAGVSIATINSEDFQVFGREDEIFINVVDGGDNTIDSGDYIEFYAKKNDGWNDGYVYDSLSYQPDQYYSLYNDTIRYFLSWKAGGNHKRFANESAINYTAYNTIDYVLKTNYLKHNLRYNEGPKFDDLSSPAYSKGEGWMSAYILLGDVDHPPITTDISTKNVYTGVDAPNAFGSAISASASASTTTSPLGHNHALRITYGSSNTVLHDTSFVDYQLINKSFEIPPANLDNPTTSFTHTSYLIGQSTDKQYVSSVTVTYPHTMDFENEDYFEFTVPFNSSESKSRISFTNFNSSNPILYILNGDTIKNIPIVDNSGTWEALIPNLNTGDDAICLLVDENNFSSITDLTPVNKNGQFGDYSTLLPNDAYIIITHSSLMNESRLYSDYRASIGGSHDTVLVDIEELYNQFSGGVYKHAGAIKRFCEMAVDSWPSIPKHIFIIGKSVRDTDEYASVGSRHSTLSYQSNLVPSFGYPSSDNHLTVGLGSNPNVYAIPIGRYSATDNTQVLEYLNKVTEYEQQQDPFSSYSIENKEWQKNVLHFAGGDSENQQNILLSYLDRYKTSIEDTLFGGTVDTYFKDPTSSILNNDDFFEIQQKLLDGVSLITFFGHASSGTGFSQNIDSPDSWNNEGKYPLVIGLGCYTGDVHQPSSNSYAESIVRPAEEGAIAFNSTVKLGYINYLDRFTSAYHQMLGKDHYGETIGTCMLATVDSLITTMYPNILFHSNINGMSLQGDPAIKLNYHENPELVLDPSRIWTTPSVIDLSVDSFDLNIVITNIGSAFIDTFNLEIERHFPNGNDSLYTVQIPGSSYRDTINFTLASNHSIAIGVNDFDIRVDLPLSKIVEHNDEFNNNQITFSTFISSNELFPIWPYDYAIIPSDTIICKASTLNPFAGNYNYIFEIDTTDLFNSPYKKHQFITSAGGVVEAPPSDWINSSTQSSDPLTFTDSTVYFWRCSPDSSTLSWQESSFQYIPEKWGWGQSHFYQYKNDEYTNINYNRTTRTFDFEPSKAKIECNAYISTGGWTSPEWSAFGWKLNGQVKEYGGWNIYPAMHVAVIDPNTLKEWRTPAIENGDTVNADHCFGQFNVGAQDLCPNAYVLRPRSEGHFIYLYDAVTHIDNLVNFLDNIIPVGHYILVYSYIPNGYSITAPKDLYGKWSPALFNSFQNLGATSFTPGMANDGFIFFCQKGDPTTVQEFHTADTVAPGVYYPTTQLIHFEEILEGSSTTGQVKSETAGPATSWNALYWKQSALEANSEDTTRLLLYGVDYNGIETLVMDTVFSTNDSILNLNNIMDASIYPLAKLEAYTQDETTTTPAQFNRWQLIYEPVPELALNPKKGTYFSAENNVQEGDSIDFAIAIENISAFDMDSLKVDYWIQDANHSHHLLEYDRQDSLRAGDIYMDTITYSTKSFTGTNSIWLAANPRVSGSIQDQPEQFYFNNIAQKSFSVDEDEENPILDVTFDGIHILNGDIVSPVPFISITLDDENEFLLMDEDADTSLFQVFLKLPESNSYTPLYFSSLTGDDYLHWEPATDSKNKFKIEYNPTFTEDGIYTLKVQGRDKSNNFSGDVSYEIEFEVITKSSITHLFNYPNPFSTKTHFVFTLTGSETPDDIMIQIMTITGKVVREIFMDELGPIHIGNNRTEFFWDGRDQFGDQLANGVYLYRVIAKIDGEEIEHRSTSADEKSFKKGFGKMYLMR